MPDDDQMRGWLAASYEVLGKILAEQPLAVLFDWTITPSVVTATLNQRIMSPRTIRHRYTQFARALGLEPGEPIQLGPREARLLTVGSRDHIDLVVTATLATDPIF